MSNHQKHTKLTKPALGNFGRQEVAIMGTPCGNIKRIARELVNRLQPYHTAYIDADHKSGDDTPDPSVSLSHGSIKEYTDKIHYNQINFSGEFNDYQRKKYFQNIDLVIVNGNHFTATEQILVIDPKKDLGKKLNKITNVTAILTVEENGEIPDFLKEHLSEYFNSIPQFNISDLEKVENILREKIINSVPSIKGLLLGGGKSTRMKRDKTLLDYHGKPQRDYALELLEGLTQESYFSCRSDQLKDIPNHVSPIVDTFDGLGPFGGILSAFRSDPNSAWLTIAVDLPMLDSEILDFLIQNRNPSKLATSFLDPKEEFPEPLITIWEPKAYPEMLYFLSLGYSCPRKVLINSDIELLKAPDSGKLLNVNDPEEYQEVMNRLQTI